MTHLKFSFKLLFVLLTVACQRQTDELILYLHDEWQFKKAGTDSQHKAKIPGEIHTDLLRAGLIPGPFYLDNEYKLQWIGKTN